MPGAIFPGVEEGTGEGVLEGSRGRVGGEGGGGIDFLDVYTCRLCMQSYKHTYIQVVFCSQALACKEFANYSVIRWPIRGLAG